MSLRRREDLDTTLTVLAGNCYRLLARKLPRYELATPDRLWRHFIDDTGTVNVADDHVKVDLALRTYTPVLIDAGFPDPTRRLNSIIEAQHPH